MRALCVVITFTAACGVAPVTTQPSPPPLTAYAGPHQRPRAYGGGVCPLHGRHEHVYLAVPPEAFVDDGSGAYRDTRLP